MKEPKVFYSNLYQFNSSIHSEILTDAFLENTSVSTLFEKQKGKCEEKLTAGECFNALNSFQKNITQHLVMMVLQ